MSKAIHGYVVPKVMVLYLTKKDLVMPGFSLPESGFWLLVILLPAVVIWQAGKLRLLKKRMKQQTEEWQERLQVKSNMISALSHEVLTPLRMMAAVARREMDRDLLPDNARITLEKIGRTADLLYHTSLSIITWMKYHTNDQTTAKEMVFPVEVAGRAIDLLSYVAENKQVRIMNMIPGKIRLYTDMTLLQIILLNLLSNAIKFSAGGAVAFYAGEKNGEVHISVLDSGLGFREDVLQQLKAHAGRHLSATGTRGEPGHGMGYTIILHFLQQLGGTLEIDNRPGKGATVTVILPGAPPRKKGE
jgi:signal transduction histidine kinase